MIKDMTSLKYDASFDGSKKVRTKHNLDESHNKPLIMKRDYDGFINNISKLAYMTISSDWDVVEEAFVKEFETLEEHDFIKILEIIEEGPSILYHVQENGRVYECKTTLTYEGIGTVKKDLDNIYAPRVRMLEPFARTFKLIEDENI